MENRDERLETAVKMIEMHLGIHIAKEDIEESVAKAEKRKKRTNRFGNEFSKMEGKLQNNKSRSEAYEDEFLRIYADLEKKESKTNF